MKLIQTKLDDELQLNFEHMSDEAVYFVEEYHDSGMDLHNAMYDFADNWDSDLRTSSVRFARQNPEYVIMAFTEGFACDPHEYFDGFGDVDSYAWHIAQAAENAACFEELNDSMDDIIDCLLIIACDEYENGIAIYEAAEKDDGTIEYISDIKKQVAQYAKDNGFKRCTVGIRL